MLEHLGYVFDGRFPIEAVSRMLRRNGFENPFGRMWVIKISCERACVVHLAGSVGNVLGVSLWGQAGLWAIIVNFRCVCA